MVDQLDITEKWLLGEEPAQALIIEKIVRAWIFSEAEGEGRGDGDTKATFYHVKKGHRVIGRAGYMESGTVLFQNAESHLTVGGFSGFQDKGIILEAA